MAVPMCPRTKFILARLNMLIKTNLKRRRSMIMAVDFTSA